MALFRQSPEKSVVKDRDVAQANVIRLAAKLTEAESAVIATKNATWQVALAGDDDGLDAAESVERAALHRLGTLSAAHTEAGKLLALLDSQIAEMQDAKTRAATNAAVLALADELIEVAAAYDASTAALAKVAGHALVVTMEANGLHVFTTSSRIEVDAAAKVVATCLREHGRAVLNGLAPAAMPKPAPIPAKPVEVVKAPLTRVFSTRPVKWRDADGAQRAGGKFVDIDVPAATAKRALACGAALALDHPERKKNLGTWPGNVSLANCYDLDAPGATPLQHDPLIHSAFQPVDRGKPFQLKIAAGGA
jgi:hypothetical protein